MHHFVRTLAAQKISIDWIREVSKVISIHVLSVFPVQWGPRGGFLCGTSGQESKQMAQMSTHPTPKCLFGSASYWNCFCQIWGKFPGRLCQGLDLALTHRRWLLSRLPQGRADRQHLPDNLLFSICLIFFHIKKLNLTPFPTEMLLVD